MQIRYIQTVLGSQNQSVGFLKSSENDPLDYPEKTT